MKCYENDAKENQNCYFLKIDDLKSETWKKKFRKFLVPNLWNYRKERKRKHVIESEIFFIDFSFVNNDKIEENRVCSLDRVSWDLIFVAAGD